ncbi:MAG: phosphoglucosamine mutase [Pseudomonadota bacterium]
MGKLFGTDGIRGVANHYPITVEMALSIGRAAAFFAFRQGFASIVIGKDTRASGDMLESALSAGIAAMGMDVFTAGVIPTPGVAFLTSRMDDAGLGIVISASHNPYQDNGIKFFNADGRKLTDEEEDELETCIIDFQSGSDPVAKPGPDAVTGRISPLPNAIDTYARFLKDTWPEGFNTPVNVSERVSIVIDCANGASGSVAPLVFEGPRFDVNFIFNTPDGRNINKNCGSQHTETLSKTVLSSRAHIGLAFDGDSDRLVAVDEKGETITGDRILAICAGWAKDRGRLAGNCVVSTVMSNIGLTKALESKAIRHIIAGVGDRDVKKKMDETGAVMGGEDSGHMIFADHHSTGDGILTAIRLLEVMTDTGKPLSELASVMAVYPQILMNVEVDASRPDFMKIADIANEISAVEAELNNSGRVLVRYSGTQPLLRVMVEGPDLETTQAFCRRICDAIRNNMQIGVKP